jgi:hypothetical protein
MRNKREQKTYGRTQSDNMNVFMSMVRLCKSQLHEERVERNEQRWSEQKQARRFAENTRKANDRQLQQMHRTFTYDSFLRLVFNYEPDIE